jgi:hypothetical protein
MKRTRRKVFVSFKVARQMVKELNLKGYNYWNKNKTVYKFILKNDIPVNPCDYYKNKGWVGWANFLGTGNSVGGQKAYTINDDFFKVWSCDMAYILGLWWADGCIYKNIFTISLHVKDRQLLKNILGVMESDSVLRKTGDNVRFEIVSRAIVSDIINLGGQPRKSLVAKFPEIPEKYLSDFIRGYWDGDGTIHIHNKKYYISGCVSGSKEFVYKLSDVLKMNIVDVKPAVRVEKSKSGGTYYRIEMGYNDTRRLRDFMYNSGSILKMDRKYRLFRKAGNITKNYNRVHAKSKNHRNLTTPLPKKCPLATATFK